jgi:predicted ATPase
VQQPRHVAAVIASTLGVRSFRDLSNTQTLVILDNFEHLLDAAPAVGALLAAAPAMRVLVTSRAPLRVDGEREYPLEPLGEDDAVALLTDRARAVRPGFAPDDATRMICRRLDGLPLAIELAATQLRSLASSALLDRLDPRLPLLTSGARDLPKRQRTLRATIAWSYNLLGGDLRYQFARLAVFAGSFSPDAAEVVAEATPDDLRALVEASLLQREGEDRLFMLETIREFASERLEADRPGELRARHAEFFVALAERACLTIEASGPMNHLVVMPEHDNFRAALEWSIRAGRLDVGLRLATALDVFWVTTDPLEGVQWFERLLESAFGAPQVLTARARRVYGELFSIIGDFERAERLWEESLAEFRVCGDEGGAAACLSLLAICAGRREDVVAEKELAEQSLQLFQKTGSRKGEAQVRGLLAARALAAGEDERGLALLDQAIELAHDAGFHWWEKNELCFLAERLLERGRLDDATERANEALRLSRQIHDRVGQIDSLTILAHIAAERGEPEVAGRLWGVVEAEAALSPFPGWERTRRLHTGAILTGTDFEAARAEGNRIALETVVADCIP